VILFVDIQPYRTSLQVFLEVQHYLKESFAKTCVLDNQNAWHMSPDRSELTYFSLPN
jgi:hypothetical protein